MYRISVYKNLVIALSFFIYSSIFSAQEDEVICVLWSIVEDNQVIQFDLLTGDRLTELELHAISFSPDTRFLISHTFEDGIDNYIRTNMQTEDTTTIAIERHDGEFIWSDIPLSSDLIIVNYNTPLLVNNQMSLMSSRRLLDWGTQQNKYFPYSNGQVGFLNNTEYIGIQWQYDSALHHDEDATYEKFAIFSFENESLTFSSTDNLSNPIPINLAIPPETIDNTSWDWSDSYGLVWYEEYGEVRGGFAWSIEETQHINLEINDEELRGELRISPDGQYLLAETFDYISVYDLSNQEIIYNVSVEHDFGYLNARWIDNRQIIFITRETGQTTFYIVEIDTGEVRTFYDELFVYTVAVPETNNCN